MYMDVSEKSGTPKSSILKGFSIINHLFWGTSIFGNTHILRVKVFLFFHLYNFPWKASCVWFLHGFFGLMSFFSLREHQTDIDHNCL